MKGARTHGRGIWPWAVVAIVGLVALAGSLALPRQPHLFGVSVQALLAGASVMLLSLSSKGVADAIRHRRLADAEDGFETYIYTQAAAKTFRDSLVILILVGALSLSPAVSSWPPSIPLVGALVAILIDYWVRHLRGVTSYHEQHEHD